MLKYAYDCCNDVAEELEARCRLEDVAGDPSEEPLSPHLFTQPRQYQVEILEKAKVANTIAYLDTGTGKTLIGVLLLKHRAPFLRGTPRRWAFFLVPKIVLVKQQAAAIEKITELKVGRYKGCDSSIGSWSAAKWAEELDKFEVLVMTYQLLLNMLRSAYVTMEMIDTLIIDECHHCTKDDPSAQLMLEFYHRTEGNKPRVFGMTASPLNKKGVGSERDCLKQLEELERILDAKLHTVQDRDDLERAAPTPHMLILNYSAPSGISARLVAQLQQLAERKKSELFHGTPTVRP